TLVPDKKLRFWVIRWLAHMLQHPRVKMQSALVLYGKQGRGKTTFAHVLLRRVFGPSNVFKVGPKAIEDKYNGWARNTQIVVAEEVSGDSSKQDYSSFKDQISADEIDVREMYQPL